MSVANLLLGAASSAKFTVATGGTVTTDGNYKVHTFTGGGTFSVSQVGDDPSVSYLIAAGGAAGGGGYGGSAQNWMGGGGGAGGLLTGTTNVSATSYTITVGRRCRRKSGTRR